MTSLWGAVLGGVSGFALGGPLGALMGAALGHAINEYLRDGATTENDPEKSVVFTIACIALCAKLAKADGQVTRDEVDAFREVFHVPRDQEVAMARVFDQARRDARGFEPYARQVADLFADRPDVLEKLVAVLFHIAKADGVVSPSEVTYLRAVSDIFGFDQAQFERVRAIHTADMHAQEDDPHIILGVAPDAPEVALRAAYRQRMRESHPDTLIAKGMPEELVAIANEEVSRINTAWEEIKRRRGLR